MILTPFTSKGNISDTIKPIPQINKEFLVVAHIVANPDSSLDITQADISATLAGVSQIFAPIGASFTVCEYRIIYNFQYDEINGSIQKELNPQYKVDKRINIFYIPNFKDDLAPYCGNAQLGGISNTSGSITIKMDCNTPSTVAHELGHYFSLPHTFQGGGSELVNGSYCQTTGDGICDTPSDPYVDPEPISSYVNSDCLFISQKKDANGDYYNPDVSNIMGYYTPCRCLTFTRGQFEKMANYYLNNANAW